MDTSSVVYPLISPHTPKPSPTPALILGVITVIVLAAIIAALLTRISGSKEATELVGIRRWITGGVFFTNALLVLGLLFLAVAPLWVPLRTTEETDFTPILRQYAFESSTNFVREATGQSVPEDSLTQPGDSFTATDPDSSCRVEVSRSEENMTVIYSASCQTRPPRPLSLGEETP